jgi:ATP-dependent DNA ligase
MSEIKVMLLTEVWDKSILDDTTKWFQVKENGVRALIHIKDGKIVGIRNRSNNPIFYCFPEFKELTFPYKSAILDAEIVVIKDGKSVFYSGIDKRRSYPSENVLKDYPATIVVFDALKINDESLIMKPYKYRYEKLSGISTKIKVAENFYNGRELWEKVVKENLEGIVIKDPNAIYEVDKRVKHQLKLKNYKITQITVDKSEQNEKGTKVFAKTNIDGVDLEVECQLGGVFGVENGTTHYIKYLDIYGNRMIQPTKVSRAQMEG